MNQKKENTMEIRKYFELNDKKRYILKHLKCS